MKKYVLFSIFSVFLLLSACAPQEPVGTIETTDTFIHEEYDFRLSYPPTWEEVTRDLPNRWAVLDENSNTILFTVNEPTEESIELLGQKQILIDYFPEGNSTVTDEEFRSVLDNLKVQEFNGQEFYTYGLSFGDKGLRSLVSGTLCNGKEVTIVLVSQEEAYEFKKIDYQQTLDSFECLTEQEN